MNFGAESSDHQPCVCMHATDTCFWEESISPELWISDSELTILKAETEDQETAVLPLLVQCGLEEVKVSPFITVDCLSENGTGMTEYQPGMQSGGHYWGTESIQMNHVYYRELKLRL